MKLIKNYVKNKYNLYDLDELNEIIENIKQQYENKIKCNEELYKDLIKKNNEEIKNDLSKLLKDIIFANKEGKLNFACVYVKLKSRLNEIIDKLDEN